MKIGKVEVLYHDGDLVTTLPDGAVVHAVAHQTAEYAAMAQRLGYPNAEALNRNHDLVHTMLANWLGLEASPALTAAFTGEAVTALTGAEEDAVMAIQRFANLAGVDLLSVARGLEGCAQPSID